MIPDNLYELYEEEDDSIEIMESGEWISEGKYDLRSTIIRQYETYYNIVEMRTGSYWTDYHYDDPHITVVKPITETITVTKWVKA